MKRASSSSKQSCRLQVRCDILLVVVLAAIAGLASYRGAHFIDPSIFNKDPLDVDSTWFEADVVRVFTNMSDRSSNHYRTKVHPLFSLISYASVYTFKKMLGLQSVSAVQIVIASVASLWISALFILLRLVGCRQFDALLFSILAMTSAAAIFWFVVPTTYSFGSLSILLALCLVAGAQHNKLSDWSYVSLSALTLSFTVTNWMAGMLATLVNHPWKRALQLTVKAFCLVVLLWGVQKFLFPSAMFFIGDREEAQYILAPESGGPLHVLMSFVFHTMVMPEFEVIDRYNRPDWPVMITQRSLPGSGGPWGTVAVVSWGGLVGLGLWSLLTRKEQPRLRMVLGLTLLGQLALHLVYGDETFLYALHFGPLLVVMAALTTLTRLRLLGLALAGMLVISAGINNGFQFTKAIELLESFGPPRRQVALQMTPSASALAAQEGTRSTR